jgi:hypothetical protein
VAFCSIALFAYLAGFGYLPQSNPSQKNPQATNEQQGATAPQQNPTRSPITIEGPITVIQKATAEDEARYAEQVMRENRLFWVAVIAALAAFLAYLANRREANAAEKQVELLKEQLADAKADAAEQRHIAHDTLALAEKEFVAANSPRLYVDGVSAVDFDGGEIYVFA